MKLLELKRFVVRKGKEPIGKWQDPKYWLNYKEALEQSKYIPMEGFLLYWVK